MKKLLLFIMIAALAFVGCSDDDTNQTIVVDKGTTVESLVVENGQKAIIEGTVKTLTVKGGDVVVEKDGKVNSINIPAGAGTKDDAPTIIIKTDYRNIGPITNTGGALIYWTAYNAPDLRTILEKPANQNAGAFLGNNIASDYDATANLGAYNVGSYDQATALLYQPTPYDGYVLDGQGFTLSGAGQQNVLFISSHDVVVKNIVVTQTAANKTDKANNGIQVYWVTGVKLENVTSTNCGRAGMIVNGSTATATDLKTSLNAWGGVNVGFPGSPNEGARNPEFTMTNDGDLKENFKIYVDYADKDRHKVTVPAGWESSEIQEATKITIAYYPKGQKPTV